MKLIWVRTAQETLIGEVGDRYSVTTLLSERALTLGNPTALQYVNVPAPSAVIGKRPDMIIGFKLTPIPCSEILVKEISYAGMIDSHNPVAVTYAKVKEAVQEQANSPLMVAQ